jgi:hypothetical protein
LKTQNMTSRGGVPVRHLLQEDSMRKFSNPPVERAQIKLCTSIRLYNSRFVFKNDQDSRLDDPNRSYKIFL